MTRNAIVNRRIQQIRHETAAVKEDIRHIVPGYIVEVNGSIQGPRNGWVWFKALEDNSPPRLVRDSSAVTDIRANMAVLIERDPKEPYPWKIVRLDRDRYFAELGIFNNLPGGDSPPHRSQHEWVPGRPGADPVRIYPRAITDFQVLPTNPASMWCVIGSGWYQGAANWERFKGPVYTQDFTGVLPSTTGSAILAAITLDSTGAVGYYYGDEFANGLVPGTEHLPSVDREVLILSAIKLYQGMTEITEADFEYDIRPLFGSSGFSGGTWVRSGSNVYYDAGVAAVGVTADQTDDTGAFHWYRGTGGGIMGVLTAVDGTSQTILADGDFDVVEGVVSMHVIIKDSSGAATTATVTASSLPSTSDITPSGGNTIRFSFNADGSITAARQAGSETFEVVYDLIYM